MAKNDDVLILTRKHELNYRALCNFIFGQKIRTTDSRRNTDIIPWSMKFKLLHRQDYACAHCGKDFIRKANGRWDDVTADHVIAFQYGGEANYDNMVLVHYACNLERSKNYSLEIIEDHYGRIDMDMIEHLPVVQFHDWQIRRAFPDAS